MPLEGVGRFQAPKASNRVKMVKKGEETSKITLCAKRCCCRLMPAAATGRILEKELE